VLGKCKCKCLIYNELRKVRAPSYPYFQQLAMVQHVAFAPRLPFFVLLTGLL